MWKNIKKTFQRLKKHEPGERFGAFYREQRHQPLWVKIVLFLLAFVAFAIGVVLAFIPGPAVVFFALSLALLSVQSRFVAQALDKGEIQGRKILASLELWWRHRRERRARQRKTGHARG